MSRSRRKTPVCDWFGCESEKKGKWLWHRRMRAMIRQRLLEPDLDAILLPLDNEVSNTWWALSKEKKKRFNPREHPEWMRK